jgi:hypothetical protein
MSEPLNSTNRIELAPSDAPPPPWTGVKFTCEQCGAEYQLEAADSCELRLILNDRPKIYTTPPCRDCGRVNVIELGAHASSVSQPASLPADYQIGGAPRVAGFLNDDPYLTAPQTQVLPHASTRVVQTQEYSIDRSGPWVAVHLFDRNGNFIQGGWMLAGPTTVADEIGGS